MKDSQITFVWRHLQRGFSSDLLSVPVMSKEVARLGAAGISAAPLQRFAVWRRSTLLIVLVPTLLAALLATADTLGQGRQGLSRVGQVLVTANMVGLWAMPITALFASRAWASLRRSHRILVVGWIIAFVTPFIIALFPLQLWFDPATTSEGPGQHLEDAVLDTMNGLHVAFTLLPTALSVLPGLVRSCIRVKTLMPEAILPGWFLMVGPPFYLLLWLLGLVVLNHLAASPLLVFGVLFLVGAPMVYVWRADLFVRPLKADECRAIHQVRRWANISAAIGGLLLLVYLFTKQVFGLYLLGLAPGESLIWLWQSSDEIPNISEALAQARSILWVGDFSLSQVVMQYCGRSLFMTTVFADALIMMNLSLWRQEKKFSRTIEAGKYDITMAEFGRLMERSPE